MSRDKTYRQFCAVRLGGRQFSSPALAAATAGSSASSPAESAGAAAAAAAAPAATVLVELQVVVVRTESTISALAGV